MLRRRAWLIAVLAIALLGLAYRPLTRNRLTVTNESGQAVTGLTIEIGGETHDFGDLAPGASAETYFRFDREDAFRVRCKLADGTIVRASAGHMVWEQALFGINAGLKIGPNGMLTCSH